MTDRIVIDTTQSPEQEREFLFELDGTEYTIPVKLTVGQSMQHRINVAELGTEYAIVVAARWMISDGGFNTVLSNPGIPDSALDAILTAVTYRVSGMTPGKSGGAAGSDPRVGVDPRLADAGTGVASSDRTMDGSGGVGRDSGVRDGDRERPASVPSPLAGRNFGA